MIINPSTKEVISSVGFTGNETEKVITCLEAHNISPLVYSYINGIEKVSWVTSGENEGINRYLSLRKGDRRLRPLSNINGLYDGDIFYFTCIGEKEQLMPVYAEIHLDGHYTCTFQQEFYRPEYWCEIMPRQATKANAVNRLKVMWNCDRVISFGDAINDIPMFKISDECYAAANAAESLKRIATGIIESNDDDGVAKWLAENALVSGK